jgi:hypothetical protein
MIINRFWRGRGKICTKGAAGPLLEKVMTSKHPQEIEQLYSLGGLYQHFL